MQQVSGVVDQHIDPSELLEANAHSCSDAGLVGHIQSNGQHPVLRALLDGPPGKLLWMSGPCDDPTAMAESGFDHVTTDALGGPGHEPHCADLR